MKKRSFKIILSTLLVFLMVFSMVPQFGTRVYAETEIYTGTDILGQGVNSPSAKVVNYGGRSWYVVGYNGTGSASAQGEMVLFMKGIETNAPYNNNLDPTYKGCTLQTTIDNFVNDNFSAEEKAAVIPKTLNGMDVDDYDDWWWYDNFHTVDDVPFEGVTVLAWPLGANEARTVNQELRKADYEYWLRSLGTVGYVDWLNLLEVSDLMAIVLDNGDVDLQWDDENITWWKGVRPGFKMKMDSVLMTTLTSTGEYKLTLKDEARKNFSVDNCDNSINASGDLVVKYQNAVAGENEHISYIIKDKDGNIKKYQSCDKVSSASGTATLTGLPKDASGKISLGEGDKLYVFNEQVNGDKKSNLASELIELSTSPGHDWDFWYFNCPIYGGKKTAFAGYKCQINPMHIQYVEATIETDGGTATCEDYIAVKETVSISADKALDGIAREKTSTGILMPLGHDWGEPTYEWSADNKTVTAKRVCKRDPSHIETETVSATESITEWPTCSATGLATYTSNAFANSAFTVQTKTGVEVPVDPEEHDWNDGEDIEAQNICGGHGTLYTCNLCDATKIESNGGHDWETEKSILNEPTCEEQGDIAYKCKNCSAYDLDSLDPIDPLGHDWGDGVITKKATCTEDGVKTFTCAHDASHIKTEVITKTGHTEDDPVSENVAPATCETAGSYDEVVYCATCNAELSREKKTVDALGHAWSEWTRTKEPTCTESSTEEKVCSHDATHKESRVVEALGHDWGEWTVTKERSETEEGIETRTCNHDSSHTETRSIPKIKINYRNTEGDGTEWTQGSEATADFTFKRSTNDGDTFEHFTGIAVDGAAVDPVNYTAVSGSVIVKLKPSYLETLSAGDHTLTALFDDGNNVTVNFTITAQQDDSDIPKEGVVYTLTYPDGTVVKLNASGEPLTYQDVQDALKKENWLLMASGLKSDAKGQVMLPADWNNNGTIRIVETKVPVGYTKGDVTEQTVLLKDGSVTFVNPKVNKDKPDPDKPNPDKPTPPDKKDEPDSKKSPDVKTGDENGMAVSILTFLLSSIALVMVIGMKLVKETYGGSQNSNYGTSRIDRKTTKTLYIIFVILIALVIGAAIFTSTAFAADGFVINKVDDNGDPVEGAVFDVYGKPEVSREEVATTPVSIKVGLNYRIFKDADASWADIVASSQSVTVSGGSMTDKTLTFTPGTDAQEVELPGEGTYTITMSEITQSDLKSEADLAGLTYIGDLPFMIDTVSVEVTVDADGNCTLGEETYKTFVFGADQGGTFIYNDIPALKLAYGGTGADDALNELNPYSAEAGVEAAEKTVTLTTVISQYWIDQTEPTVK